MNEEEIKVKIVLPFLERLGFTASDLQLETSFFLRLGRHVLDMSTGKKTKRDGAGARLDILVKRNDENLFIVETKEAQQVLNDDDRDQAISYARLVHPVAPYALVTNGTKYILFDSLTRQECDPAMFPLKDNYQVSLPEESRSEALSYFLGYSQQNVISRSVPLWLAGPRGKTMGYMSAIPPALLESRALLGRQFSGSLVS